MAILAECPICHRKQANKNRISKGCSERVRYWITHRLQGKQRREAIGFSLSDAQV